MEIKKKQIDPSENPQNPMGAPAPPLAALTPAQEKTATAALGAIGNLSATKTSPPSGEILINKDLLTFELQEIEHIILFIFSPTGSLELFKGDPALASLAKIGNQYFIKEHQQDAILAHLDKNDYQIGPVDFRELEKTVIPEELWGELHIQIANLKPLLQTVVSLVSEAGSTSERKIAPKTEHRPTPKKKAKTPRFERTPKAMKLEQAMTQFVQVTNQIIKAQRENRKVEKMEEEKAHKEEIIRKEVEHYEQKLKLIKESTTQEEMLSHLKDWAESLPPCPIRLLNAITMWRELVNKCVVKNAIG
jgi:chemotaxis protein histidine kinase CheA